MDAAGPVDSGNTGSSGPSAGIIALKKKRRISVGPDGGQSFLTIDGVLTRLTLAFSKKRANFEAAVGLHFAYYNFCRVHQTLRVTPAMEAGIADHVWSVRELRAAADENKGNWKRRP